MLSLAKLVDTKSRKLRNIVEENTEIKKQRMPKSTGSGFASQALPLHPMRHLRYGWHTGWCKVFPDKEVRSDHGQESAIFPKRTCEQVPFDPPDYGWLLELNLPSQTFCRLR